MAGGALVDYLGKSRVAMTASLLFVLLKFLSFVTMSKRLFHTSKSHPHFTVAPIDPPDAAKSLCSDTEMFLGSDKYHSLLHTASAQIIKLSTRYAFKK